MHILDGFNPHPGLTLLDLPPIFFKPIYKFLIVGVF